MVSNTQDRINLLSTEVAELKYEPTISNSLVSPSTKIAICMMSVYWPQSPATRSICHLMKPDHLVSLLIPSLCCCASSSLVDMTSSKISAPSPLALAFPASCTLPYRQHIVTPDQLCKLH